MARRIEDDDRAEIVGVTPDMTREEAVQVIAEQLGAKVELPDWDAQRSAIHTSAGLRHSRLSGWQNPAPAHGEEAGADGP